MNIDSFDKNDNITPNKLNNNNYNNNNTKIEIDEDINIFPKNKKNIYSPNQNPLKNNKNLSSGELSLCEGRLLNDLAEFKRSKIIGKICNIKLYDYKRIENNCFELIIDFISYFSVKFIFNSDYPCSPPIILHDKGIKPKNIFDENGNALIESTKKINWTPSIWLSTLVYSIELLISSYINSENKCSNYNDNNQGYTNYFMKVKKQKYGKRKWNIYIDEYNDYFSKECIIIPELEKNLKKLKI